MSLSKYGSNVACILLSLWSTPPENLLQLALVSGYIIVMIVLIDGRGAIQLVFSNNDKQAGAELGRAQHTIG